MLVFVFFFFKQKTAYEMRISDWSSDVCSSDLSLKDQGILTTWLQACFARGRNALLSSRGERRWFILYVLQWLPLQRSRPAISDSKRSEEHTSDLQSLMRISYAVFCLKKKRIRNRQRPQPSHTILTLLAQPVTRRHKYTTPVS